MRFVFVMDGLDRLVPDKDTTVGFVLAAQERGHECFHALITDLEFAGGQVVASAGALSPTPEGGIVAAPKPQRLPLGDVAAVFIRKDPPFDRAYSYATMLLEHLRGTTLVLNDPRGLREANEKLYTLHFLRHSPHTLVSANPQAIHEFVEQVGGAGVIKPLDGAGGFAVMAVRTGDANAKSIVDVLTSEGRRLAVVQEYLPAVMDGDKRALLLDGEPLGTILRRPTGGDLRANIHVGAEVTACELSEREQRIVADMAPRLRADGLYFVGLDFVGEMLTEVNVTSPTGIRELGSLTNTNPSERVIEWVEQRVAGLRE